MKNCVEIIRPFVEAIEQEGIDLQIMGGNGAAALVHPETVVVQNERRIIAPKDFKLDQYRPDGNKRDLDVLVKTTDAKTIEQAENVARSIIGDELELSFFGLRPIAQLDAQTRQWFLSLAKVWVGDRYVEEDDGQLKAAKKALFPFAVDVDPHSFENWQLFVGERDPHPAPIPHPGQTILNYATRAVMGLRPKDAEKIGTLSDNVLTRTAEIKAWIVDGPGGSQVELARILWSLHSKKGLRLGEALNLSPYAGELGKDQAFMLPDAPAIVKSLILAATKLKAQADYHFASHPTAVTFWQRHVEPRIGNIIKNQ